MNIDIIAVGKLREKFYKDAADEYIKRLSRYAKVHVCEVEETRKPDTVSDRLSLEIRESEGERIRRCYRNGAYRIALVIGGKELDSVQLSEKIGSIGLSGKDTIQFMIGGAIGLGDSIMKEADLCLSFSRMTFPHELMRVILLEQIYRSFRILRGEPYHK